MKKLKTLLTLAMVALMSLSFTSCDEDANTAYYLDGTWRGNMYVNSSYNGDLYFHLFRYHFQCRIRLW